MAKSLEDFYRRLTDDVEELRAAGRLRSLRETTTLDAGLARVDGETLVNLSSNDYLGIAGDVALRRRFLETLRDDATLEELAFSSASSRLLTGATPASFRLETALSERFGGRSTLVFNSGYHANLGILPALATKNDLILADRLVHASLIDGIRLTEAKLIRYPHLNCDRLEAILEEKRNSFENVFIATESLFSMDGDEADLIRLTKIRKSYDAILLVDEAHSVGVYGPSGAGLAAELGVLNDVDILVGGLGKALGSVGSFGVFRPEIRETLINRMRPLIFSTALPPIQLAWSLFSLRRVAETDVERARLRRYGTELRTIIDEKYPGATVPGRSQIVPLVVGSEVATLARAQKLRDAGFLTFAVRPPTVPAGTSRLRFSLSAAIKGADFERLKDVL